MSKGKKIYPENKDGVPIHCIEYVKLFGEIPDGYEVHHIDLNIKNNSAENLIALPSKFHKWIHGRGFDGGNVPGAFAYPRLVADNLINKSDIQFLLDEYLNFKINIHDIRNRFIIVFLKYKMGINKYNPENQF